MSQNEQTNSDIDIDNVPLTYLERWSGQWKILYEHKRKLHDVSTEQIIIGQIFTMVVALAAGIILSENREALLVVGTSLVLYPALADMLSSNAAVLSTSVHHDIDQMLGSKARSIFLAFIKTMTVTVLASFMLGILAGLIGELFFDTSFIQTLLLASLTGSFTGLIGMPLMLGATFLVRHMQVNPDNVTAPIETAIFNSLTLVVIMILSGKII